MAMHIDIVPNRNSPPTILLRQSYREGSSVKKRTLANLTGLSDEQVVQMRMIFKGEKLVSVYEAFEVFRSVQHGNVQAVLETMRRLQMADLLNSRSSHERNLVLAMIVARVLRPYSKLATTRWWHMTSLPEELGVETATEDELYRAMDWLFERQEIIERKLASRHLSNDSVILYDLTSSYFEGEKCPLAMRGHNRDQKKGKLQVNYGLLTDSRGCPVAVEVFHGNCADPNTLLPQVRKIRDVFGVERMILVGDRGMICQKQINVLRAEGGIDWITALRTETLKRLVEDKSIQPELFDERNLFEFTHPDFPKERMVACRNPDLARKRAHTRKDLIRATQEALARVTERVGRGRLRGKEKIGVCVGKILNKYKVGKHFELHIEDNRFTFEINDVRVAEEAALDGIYVIRTSVAESRMDAAQAVRTYKSLAQVELAFRTLKSVDMLVRPIRHYTENRVKAHIFLCMLAFYVRWHMLQAWRPLLFTDEEMEIRATRDPVAPVQISPSAKSKASTRKTKEGSCVHSFSTLMGNLGSIVQNHCRPSLTANGSITFMVQTTPTAEQQYALDLLKSISP